MKQSGDTAEPASPVTQAELAQLREHVGSAMEAMLDGLNSLGLNPIAQLEIDKRIKDVQHEALS